MTKHPTYVEGYAGSSKDLAKAIGNMRYDKVAELLHDLAEDLQRQAENDFLSGKKDLPQGLEKVVGHLYQASETMQQEVWGICKLHMEDKE